MNHDPGPEAAQARPTVPAPEGPGRPHLPALDGIRGLAALLVLVHHVTPLETEAWVAGLPGLRWLHVGWIGVDLFFVLSGFLITGILLADRGSPHYLRNFYARRALRIFPLYYGVLFGLFVLLPLLLRLTHLETRAAGNVAAALQEYRAIQQHQVWLWTYLSNFAEVFADVRWRSVGHFWSLAVEEHFYLVWPFVVLVAGRRLLVVCPVIVLVALGSRLALSALGLPQGAAYVLTPCRLDGLAVGAWLAALARRPGGLVAWRGVSRWLGWAAAALVVWGFVRQGSPDHGEFFRTVGFTLLAVAFAALIVGALTGPPEGVPTRLFRSRPLRFLGQYSYGIYVYNRLLVLPVRYVVRPEALAAWVGSPWVGVLAMQAAGVAASLAVAVLSWHLYEVQFLKLKRYFAAPGGPAPPVPAARRLGEPATADGTATRDR